LITIDSSDGLVGLGENWTVNTEVSDNVKFSLKIFQNQPNGTPRAHGEEHSAKDLNKTRLVNIDATGESINHGNIDEESRSIVDYVLSPVIEPV
jgi:hypothetical protein